MSKKNNSGTDSETENVLKDEEAASTTESEAGSDKAGKDLVQDLEEKLDDAKQETAQTYDRYLGLRRILKITKNVPPVKWTTSGNTPKKPF